MSDVDLRKVVEMVGGEPVVKFIKGDVAGHEFHGNQYADAAGKAGAESAKAANASEKAKADGTAMNHALAASSHHEAKVLHTIAARRATNESDAKEHKKEAAYHEKKYQFHASQNGG
ncbi:MAG TPA: hypothetical protein VIY48_17905 [Candidatus Paceibacterota bacterium]